MSEERETSSNTSSSINNNDDNNNNNNNNNNNGTCVVCYKNVEIYSIGMCEHPVCYECSTRMRVLCRQNECPICRQDLPKVVFIKKIKPFRDIIKGNLLDTRYNIFFDNTYIQEKFTRLLSHICPICKGNKKLFGAFTGLKDHMRREHDLHYCDLCVDNLKIFTNERRCYTRFDLGVHRRKGDKDDKSHRGHPLCEFCECRYMDNDELFRHLRRDHLFCHFCDADGLHQYYDSYDYLRDHFSKEHYLCEEGPCSDEKFTSVFRSDIDLKAHKSSVHSKFMGKAAAKQARTLELEFTLAPRGDNNRNNRRGHQQSNNNNNNQTLSSPSSSSYNSRNNNTRDYYDTTDGDSSYLHESEMPSASSMKQPNVQSTQEFPSLGNAAAAPSTGPVNFSQTKSKGGRGGNLTIRGSFGSQKLSINNENFPALGSSDNGSNSGLSNIVNLNVYSSSSSSGGSSSNNNNNNNNTKNNNNNNNNKTSSSVIQTSSSPNVSIQVNHKTNGNNITTRLSRPTLKPVAQLSKKTDDFPALGGNCTSAKNSTHSTTQNTSQWTKVTCVKPSVVQQSKKIIQTPPKFNDSISEAFPSLPKTAKDKKKSSTLSVTTTSSNNTLSKIQKNDAPPSPSSSSSSSSVTAAAAAAAVVKNTKNNDTNDNSKKKKKKKTKTTTTTTTSNNSSSSESVVSKIIEKKNDDKKKPTDNNTTDLQDNNNSTKNITRKRSELKIDNLKNNISKKNNDVIDDFPALGSPRTSTPLKPPPGFSTTRPPPPPGFAVKINSIVRPQKYENNLTFTNSCGQNFPILPDKNNKKYTYLPPPDFQQRNKNLVAKISKILELKDAIEEFRYLSGLFRQDMCTAEDYYKRCRMEMGLSEFLIIFPEILVLLPDINKQRELYNLHKHETNGQIKGLELCTICGQVCKSESDIVSHLSGHTLEHDFPALGLATGTQTSNNNWPRKNT